MIDRHLPFEDSSLVERPWSSAQRLSTVLRVQQHPAIVYNSALIGGCSALLLRQWPGRRNHFDSRSLRDTKLTGPPTPKRTNLHEKYEYLWEDSSGCPRSEAYPEM